MAVPSRPTAGQTTPLILQPRQKVSTTALPTTKTQPQPNASKLSTTKKIPVQQGELFAGGAAGIEMDDQGNVNFNPEKALMGMAGMAAASKLYKTRITPETVAKNIDGADLRNIDDFLQATKDTIKIEKALNDPRIQKGLKFVRDIGLDTDDGPEGLALARRYLQDVRNSLSKDKGLVRKLEVQSVGGKDLYPTLRSKLQEGEILVKDKKGRIGAIKKDKFDGTLYERV